MKNTNNPVKVIYYDYLGFEHQGEVLLTQPCPDDDESVHYVFIKDVNPEYNDKEYIAPDGTKYFYAEIRKSTECIRI